MTVPTIAGIHSPKVCIAIQLTGVADRALVLHISNAVIGNAGQEVVSFSGYAGLQTEPPHAPCFYLLMLYGDCIQVLESL